MATTTSINTTYAGQFAGKYIEAAQLASTTLGQDLITMKPNIGLKEVVKKMVLSDILKDATCDFDPSGSIALTERILTPKELQVNQVLCKKDFINDWEALEMGFGVSNRVLPPTFADFLISSYSMHIGASIETNIWQGVDGAGAFDGFETLFAADADVLDVSGATTLSKSNIIAEMEKCVDLVPAALFGAPDLTVYVSQAAYKYYLQALGGFGASGLGANGVGGQGPLFAGNAGLLTIGGIPVVMANGLATNSMVVAQKSNLWFGTALMSDFNQVKVLDMADLDGSQNVRFIMRFTAGVQYGIGSEIVYYAG